MRRHLISLLAIIVLAVGACGTSDGNESADETTTESPSTGSGQAGEGGEGEGGNTATSGDRGGSGDLTEVNGWADDFCTSFEAWLEGITTAAGGLADGIVPGDLAAAKAVIVALFDDVAAQTTTLVDEVDRIGAPDIDGGERFAAELLDRFKDFGSAIEVARSDAEAVSTSDPTSFQAAVSELIATFQAETEAVGNSFAELSAGHGSAELDGALNAACSFM